MSSSDAPAGFPYGLSSDATRSYLRLLDGDVEPLSDPVRQELLQAGVIEPGDRPGEVVTVPPLLAVERLARSRIAETAASLTEALNSIQQMQQLPYLHSALTINRDGGPLSTRNRAIHHYYDKDEIRRVVGDLLVSSVRIIRSRQPGGPRSSEALKGSLDQDLPIAQRGVRMRSLYHDSVRADPASRNWARQFTAAGAEIRTTTSKFERMFIFDDAAALLAHPDEPDNGGAILITDRATVVALARIYDHQHREAAPFTGIDSTGPVLTSRQHEIVGCALAGHTQAAIARTVGISESLVQRETRRIRAAFGVDSDIALGRAYAQWEAQRRP